MKTPTIEKRGDSLCFVWGSVGIALDYLHERSDGIHGEITVQHEVAPDRYGHIHWARINLSSTSARDSLRKVLIGKTKDDLGNVPYEWEAMIEYACSVSARRHREGEPFIWLNEKPLPPAVSYLIGPMLPSGQTSIIFSAGGSGKSLFSLSIGLAMAEGIILPSGLRPAKRLRVLYLDYESDDDEQRTRLEWLANGMGLTSTPNILYRHQTRPIVDDIARIKKVVDEEEIGLVILDSIAYALRGSAIDADVVIEAFNALRSLGSKVTRLVIGHIPKADKDQKVGSIYGSVFFENAGRSVWEMRVELENDGVSMAMFQRKSNWGKKSPPFGLRYRFDDEQSAVMVYDHEVEGDSALITHASMSYQLTAALRQGKRTTRQLADDITGNVDSVRRTLQRMEKRGEIVSIGVNGNGPTAEKFYGLIHLNGKGA